jgi:hypothetical protein
MAVKNVNSRIVHKHGTAENWAKAINFVPMAGELIIYDIDENFNFPRVKIGDGQQNVNDLPFTAATMIVTVKDGYANYSPAEIHAHFEKGGDVYLQDEEWGLYRNSGGEVDVSGIWYFTCDYLDAEGNQIVREYEIQADKMAHLTETVLASETQVATKMDKVTGADAGNFVMLDADGNARNSSYNSGSFVPMSAFSGAIVPHMNDTTKHITDAEREAWNSKTKTFIFIYDDTGASDEANRAVFNNFLAHWELSGESYNANVIILADDIYYPASTYYSNIGNNAIWNFLVEEPTISVEYELSCSASRIDYYSRDLINKDTFDEDDNKLVASQKSTADWVKSYIAENVGTKEEIVAAVYAMLASEE